MTIIASQGLHLSLQVMHHMYSCHANSAHFTNRYHVRHWHWFGDMKCWFKHENIQESNKNKDNEELSENKGVMEKLFNMMEIMTKRIINLEERI